MWLQWVGDTLSPSSGVCSQRCLLAPALFSPLQSKKGKDPNAPKRPMSAYMLWLNASRERIKSDHPGISITDLSKKAGELWKAMSKEKKEVTEGAAGSLRCGGGGACSGGAGLGCGVEGEAGRSRSPCSGCRSGTARRRTPGGTTRRP